MITTTPAAQREGRRTLICVHAHPDDEALLTAGVMAKAAAEGNRVVLIVATRGEVGEVADDFLSSGEDLGDRRWRELERSAAILGVERLEWLGYGDSGLTGKGRPGSRLVPFAHADPNEAADRLAAIIADEHADVVTIYDRHGGYHHPDHLQVHRIGHLAAHRAQPGAVLEATINRGLLKTGLELARSLGFEIPSAFSPETFDEWFLPEESLTHRVDVSSFVDTKRASMEAHASQSTSASGGTRTIAAFLSLPPEYFALAFGSEWFAQAGCPGGIRYDDVFDVLRPDATDTAEGAPA
ncbi:MAG: PIG-L family deacetylase [Acidimicrobiales bacterium]|nr:PIG-L family deacetylase [Acidimicrobiales bacterium]